MTSAYNAIENLSCRIYDRYGMSDKTGMDFFLDYKSEIDALDKIDLIEYQMANFPHDHVIELLLSCPFIWEKFRTEDWLELMAKVKNRVATRFIEESGLYCDIEFLSRYVGVNSLEVFLSNERFGDLEKNSVKRYFAIFEHLLFAREEDFESLDGCYHVREADLRAMRDALISEGVFRSLDRD